MQYVSLFTGCGGFDLGLHQEGFECLLANEINMEAVKTLRRNFHALPIFEESVERLSVEVFRGFGIEPGSLDLVVGGPPCQAFSTAGVRGGLEDTRGNLIFEFFRVIQEMKPTFFVMENVKGLLSIQTGGTESRRLLDVLYEMWEGEGYRVDGFLMNVVNYGAPQSRERVILIGNRVGLEPAYPTPTHGSRRVPYTTLRSVIYPPFQDNDPSLMDFSSRKKSILSHVPAGGNWRDLPPDLQEVAMGPRRLVKGKGGYSSCWRRLSWDHPCPTLLTMPNHASTPLCHPEDTRSLTVGEYIAISEFPQTWVFEGTTAEKYRQIGNAVPPRLGRVVARMLLDAQHSTQARSTFQDVKSSFRIPRKKRGSDSEEDPPSLF